MLINVANLLSVKCLVNESLPLEDRSLIRWTEANPIGTLQFFCSSGRAFATAYAHTVMLCYAVCCAAADAATAAATAAAIISILPSCGQYSVRVCMRACVRVCP